MARKYSSHINEIKPIWQSISFDLRITDAHVRGISKTQARDYLQAEEGWTSAQFKEVDWDWLDKALENKPDMYKTWLAKQHTRMSMREWSKSGGQQGMR